MKNVSRGAGHYIIGMDEAGLGPVFGPMVIAGVCLEESVIPQLKQLGAKDSKLFGNGKSARVKRKNLWLKMKPFLSGSCYKIISAEEIDNCFLKGTNMYKLEICAIKEILLTLNFGSSKIIYIPQIGQTKKENIIKNIDILDSSHYKKIIYEKDADSKFIPVSVASILAKILRDNEIEKLCKNIGVKYVSGYPNHTTECFIKNFANKYKTLPQGVRKTRNWPPLKEILKKYNTQTT